MNPKEEVLKIVQAQLISAKDNLYRANRAFKGMTQEEINKEHGQSGRKRGDILDEYREKELKLYKCVDWVNSQ